MRELTISEVDQVSGGSNILAAIQEWSTFGATTGSVWGYITTSTIQGAARGGLTGGALGFAFGGGYAFGSWLTSYL